MNLYVLPSTSLRSAASFHIRESVAWDAFPIACVSASWCSWPVVSLDVAQLGRLGEAHAHVCWAWLACHSTQCCLSLEKLRGTVGKWDREGLPWSRLEILTAPITSRLDQPPGQRHIFRGQGTHRGGPASAGQ